ncbi:hypothetical protein CK203_044589 [Vitis vinifera]|uniref:Uncharacterized protein n=1 Tax=Vitis vinifera TaxID=29760 RepID=A0A438HJL8_VITVI|nr:hypothetical protein CK203_044589 [Vitis vinifera]
MYHLEHLMTPRDFFYPQVALDFYQSMTTHHVRDPTVIHFSIDGRHGILGARHIPEALHIPYEPTHPDDYRVWAHPSQSDMVHILSRGISTHSYLLRKNSHPTYIRGIFLWPSSSHHDRSSYFEEKVHKKKLLRADVIIPLLFPGYSVHIRALGNPSEPQLERRRIFREIFTLDKWTSMTLMMHSQEPQLDLSSQRTLSRHRPMPEVASFAPPTTPRTPPIVPPSEPHLAKSIVAISISDFRGLCHTLQTLTATQSVLAQQMEAIPYRSIQGPSLAEQIVPPKETTTGHIEASIPSIQTSTAEPSSPHDPPTTI